MSLTVMLCNMDELYHFYWKLAFNPSDPKWPRIDIWLHNIGRGSQADKYVWV